MSIKRLELIDSFLSQVKDPNLLDLVKSKIPNVDVNSAKKKTRLLEVKLRRLWQASGRYRKSFFENKVLSPWYDIKN